MSIRPRTARSLALVALVALVAALSGCGSTGHPTAGRTIAPPVATTPDTDAATTAQTLTADARFLLVVRGVLPNLDQVPDSGLIAIGHAVCTDFANGGDFTSVLADAANAGFDARSGGAIIGAATDVYCPGGSPPAPSPPSFLPVPSPSPTTTPLPSTGNSTIDVVAHALGCTSLELDAPIAPAIASAACGLPDASSAVIDAFGSSAARDRWVSSSGGTLGFNLWQGKLWTVGSFNLPGGAAARLANIP